VVTEAREADMLIYGWIFRDDQKSALELFNVTKTHDYFKKAIVELDIDGIITEYN
jgi:hypothetical protein